MIRCCICGDSVNHDSHTLKTNDGNELHICSVCYAKISSVLKPTSELDKRDAATYLKSYRSQIRNNQVKNYLDNILGDNPNNKSEINIEILTNENSYCENANSISHVNNSSIWISILRTIVIVDVILGIIGSIAIGITLSNFFDNALMFIIIAGIGIATTLAINAFFMIFLDMANDVSTIKEQINVLLIKNKK